MRRARVHPHASREHALDVKGVDLAFSHPCKYSQTQTDSRWLISCWFTSAAREVCSNLSLNMSPSLSNPSSSFPYLSIGRDGFLCRCINMYIEFQLQLFIYLLEVTLEAIISMMCLLSVFLFQFGLTARKYALCNSALL